MDIKKLYNYVNRELNHYEFMAKKSCESRGLPYYYGLRNIYPVHFSSFYNMHNRTKWKDARVSKRYERSLKGFINFVLDIGNVSEGMTKPSIGRINHDLGYVEGNFRWQERSENSREVYDRCLKIVNLLRNITN